MTFMPQIRASYDDVGDVLYILIAKPLNIRNVEDEAGLILRYDAITKDPVGATITDYKEHWVAHREHLVARLADFLHIPTEEAERVLPGSST